MAKTEPSADLLRIKLVDVIEQQGISVERSEVTPNASLEFDLGFDSLDCIELVMEIEERFGVQIDEETAETWKTVGDVEAWLRTQKVRL